MKKFLYIFACLFLLLSSYVISDMYTTQELQIFKARTLPQDFVFKYDDPFEEVFINTANNARINALHFRTKRPKGVVLYFHGRGWHLGARKRHGLPEDFLKRGHDLFIVDYRGFGKSTGPQSEDALHKDAEASYQYLLKTYTEQEITVYGMSFGTSIATKLAANHNPKQLILEAPYLSMLDMACRTVPHVPRWITSLVLKYHLRTDKFIKDVTCPIHLFHGTHDSLIPHISSKHLMKKIRKNVSATFVSIVGGDHDHLPTFSDYHRHLDHVLQANH